ncbi:hypothetical protein GLOIN_2v1552952 [Rhizophagus irregularis DAOM 181602=DAOM 197198]|uniref:Uncharacterized protein n=1 Tax=Rhizophagus irregularis (strain DAOM 181602 / DAOM 197198 / MUCL 43194) TaxID=747089 RepID=A0A2P4P630_RHIID|nr:hypothetical protein GLOIN_2v1709362 [Rhizophagus irregularis DAOM 181602=DAOM 197198]XP_025177796.1 hypothetical protein GLOIN_2v1611844 [Rhizophagus irregularis DAOM 181602=DAOM 197198]XP_025183721.1 hypothetical protein GLOIN_2v1552952 [Rhizophagus irregularis DAOM 181602=DAOM 197198]POG60817.1 hypothetical protein GLOIN_2v1709362 [Rhizophagus irregularis DAOM 181602=DAOM 197198]POG70930.1 hypothetical protein GLOIN_2v1611844 [Rhizophagus irregularis DAOM 181602=DAOM 197198]POG76855.1 hy|eukprot:XP_025167683.1 hypothetical protein GLOIN_2v1709362 [Rhizophagus irregularis DAOM 181602=DAOM 197198]
MYLVMEKLVLEKLPIISRLKQQSISLDVTNINKMKNGIDLLILSQKKPTFHYFNNYFLVLHLYKNYHNAV